MIFFSALILIIIIELSIYYTVINFKKKFQWLINKEDEFPIKDSSKLKKFFENNYSEKLGWDRKKNTFGYEITNKKKTRYKISSNGYRHETNKFKHSKISTFGDSYAFCRFVNDNQTWQKSLGIKCGTNVRNFGVGNYGLDQAYLKYQNTKLDSKTKLLIFTVVPETISRIHSYWKHYLEFGNIYGFKPIYYLRNGKISLKKNLLKKNDSISSVKHKIKQIRKNDIFYEIKFKKRLFKFPYLSTFLMNFLLYTKIFFFLMLNSILKNFNKDKDIYIKNARREIIKKNLYDANQMYLDKKYNLLLEKLIINMNKIVNEDKMNMLIVIVPQIYDIKLYKKNKCNYGSFFSKLKNIDILDLTKDFSKNENYKKLYTDDKYAGHLSVHGNKYLARKIFEHIKKKV